MTKKEWLIYTVEGDTIAPNGKDIDNCQLLGFVKADTAKEATAEFLREHPWAKEYGFSQVTVREVMGERLSYCLDK